MSMHRNGLQSAVALAALFVAAACGGGGAQRAPPPISAAPVPAPPPPVAQDPCVDLGPLSTPSAERKIAFVSARDGNQDIYAVHSDGSGLVRLTNDPANDQSPAWSPDRTRIAFVSDRTGTSELYVMTADGSQVVRRTFHGTDNEKPTWSPDGKRIAYSALGGGGMEIWTVGADCGTAAAPLFGAPGYDAQPAWSPSGSKIALVSDSVAYDFVRDIYVINADGTGFGAPLTNSFSFTRQQYYDRPSWSPDGARLSMAITEQIGNAGVTKLGVMNADGSGLTALISAAPFARSSWSPDGARIAYTAIGPDEEGFVLWRNVAWVSADGSASGTIVADGWDPDWQR
jgi:Tol biopolymer transport system component